MRINTQQLKEEEHRQQLLEKLKQENTNLELLLEDFYNQTKRESPDYLKLCENIIKAVDEILAAGDWESSLFLRNKAKGLQAIRDQAQKFTQQLNSYPNDQSHLASSQLTIPAGKTLVYVLLFQLNGHNLSEWESLLKVLPTYIQGRPIYQQQEEIEQNLRSRGQNIAEGYAAIMVPEKAVKVTKMLDRFGQPLVTVDEGSFKSEDVVRFVHAGQSYRFKEGHLVLVENKA